MTLEPETKSASHSQRSQWLLGLLGILGFFWFSSKLKPDFQQNRNSISPNSKAINKDQKNPNALVVVSDLPPPNPTTAKEPCECRRHKTPWWKVLLEIGTFVAAVGAFISAAVYASITSKMWKEMQEQTRIQRDTGTNTERAWVGLDVPITLDRIETQADRVRIQGHYSIKNFGHGPAFKVVQVGNFSFYPSNEKGTQQQADFSCDSSMKFSTGTVPVRGIAQPAPFGYTLFPGQGHDEIFDAQSGADTLKFLQFIGCVAYLDQFDKVHWTRFCMLRRPGDQSAVPKLDFCALYNDTDKPKP